MNVILYFIDFHTATIYYTIYGKGRSYFVVDFDTRYFVYYWTFRCSVTIHSVFNIKNSCVIPHLLCHIIDGWLYTNAKSTRDLQSEISCSYDRNTNLLATRMRWFYTHVHTHTCVYSLWHISKPNCTINHDRRHTFSCLRWLNAWKVTK